jgi:putative membrane protein insertion efficiency factor
MHGLHSTQWVTAISFWGHHAKALGECRIAQSAEAPFARGISTAPRAPAGRLGHTGESPRVGGRGPISDSGRGSSEAFPQPASSAGFGGVARQVRFITLGLIKFYQACLSPLLPSSCRFYPSCSAYAYEAVERWGAWRGIRLALDRLMRCRPYGGHGFDPVP